MKPPLNLEAPVAQISRVASNLPPAQGQYADYYWAQEYSPDRLLLFALALFTEGEFPNIT